MYLLPNDSKGLKGVSGSILLHAVVKMVKVAQYPVCSIAQSALHFTPLADLSIPTPTRLLLEAF